MAENSYKHLIIRYLDDQVNVEDFIDEYFKLWKTDRDNNITYEPKFQRLLDRIFTSCDCYSAFPNGPIEISEKELKSELTLLFYIWWNL